MGNPLGFHIPVLVSPVKMPKQIIEHLSLERSFSRAHSVNFDLIRFFAIQITISFITVSINLKELLFTCRILNYKGRSIKHKSHTVC